MLQLRLRDAVRSKEDGRPAATPPRTDRAANRISGQTGTIDPRSGSCASDVDRWKYGPPRGGCGPTIVINRIGVRPCTGGLLTVAAQGARCRPRRS